MSPVTAAAAAVLVLLVVAGAAVAVAWLARSVAAQQRAAAAEAQQRMADAFAALSAEALQRNNQAFLHLADARLAVARSEAGGDLQQRQQAIEHLVSPLQESLGRVEERLRELELARQEAYVGLTQQVGMLKDTHELLRGQTASLVNALRAPATRGRWGELQLRRVVEMAGMIRHCDFTEQPVGGGEDGLLRPDLLVRLPGGKHVVVDAKAPLQAYLDALEAPDEESRRRKLGDHARQLRSHVVKLSAKAYWEQFQPSPDFVVLFVPGDALLATALEHDPSLLDHAAEQRVLLATPVTLIAVLRGVAASWRQEELAANAREVCELGRELYKRLGTLGDHVTGLGRSLDRAIESYNKAVGSLESRVLVTARRFADLNVSDGELGVCEPVDKVARRPQAPELVDGGRIVSLPEDREVRGA